MNWIKINPAIKVAIALIAIALFFPACNTQPAATNSADKPIETSAESKLDQNTSNDHPVTSQGGDVIESGDYHLELVPILDEKSIHLDFFLQTGNNHQAISDAKVTAQVQLPNGEQKALDMAYDPEGKHYAAVLETQATGDYKIVIQTEIGTEKVNGRFSVTK
jgi:hypothetical protein